MICSGIGQGVGRLEWTTSRLWECNWTYSGVGCRFVSRDGQYGTEFVRGACRKPPEVGGRSRTGRDFLWRSSGWRDFGWTSS